MTAAKPKSFTSAAREFFALKDGQKLPAFAAELKELSYDDKVEMAQMLEAELGYEVTVAEPKKD